MNRFEVVPRRYYRHVLTDRTASLYGAAPWTSQADKANWTLVTDGFTVRDNDRGTVGFYGLKLPATREEAEAFAARMAERHA